MAAQNTPLAVLGRATLDAVGHLRVTNADVQAVETRMKQYDVSGALDAARDLAAQATALVASLEAARLTLTLIDPLVEAEREGIRECLDRAFTD